MLKSIKIHNYNLSYEDEGSGPPILFIHNGGSSHLIWSEQKDFFLKQGYRVLIPDLIGFGESDCTREDISLSFQTKIISLFLENLNLKKVQLVGVCIGANICLNLIATKAVDCQHPVLINVLPGAHLLDRHWKRILFNFLHCSPTRKKQTKYLLHSIYSLPKLSMFPLYLLFSSRDYKNIIPASLLTQYEEIYRSRVHIESRINLNQNMQSFGVENIDQSELKKITPLIIWGRLNRVTPLEHANKICKHFISHEFEIIEDAGHLLMVEAPKQLNNLVEDYITRNLNDK